ncbi:hypothetical protein WAJ74_21900, partial [Acinetobacter baumannii]
GKGLTEKEKLKKIAELNSLEHIINSGLFTEIIPNEYEDWFGTRDADFPSFIQIGNKKNKEQLTLFNSYSMGVKTNRDSWVY